MIIARFSVDVEDPRPVIWPIDHPYWISGQTMEGVFILVAYAENEDQIMTLWPEACGIESEEAAEYSFSDRFSKPEWFKQ